MEHRIPYSNTHVVASFDIALPTERACVNSKIPFRWLGATVFLHRLYSLAHRSTSGTTLGLYRAALGFESLVLVTPVKILSMSCRICSSILAWTASDQDIALDSSREYTK